MKLTTENSNTTAKWRAPYIVHHIRDRERFRTQPFSLLLNSHLCVCASGAKTCVPRPSCSECIQSPGCAWCSAKVRGSSSPPAELGHHGPSQGLSVGSTYGQDSQESLVGLDRCEDVISMLVLPRVARETLWQFMLWFRL